MHYETYSPVLVGARLRTNCFAHHACRGPQASRNLYLVVFHDISDDLLPVIPRGDHNGGDCRQPHILAETPNTYASALEIAQEYQGTVFFSLCGGLCSPSAIMQICHIRFTECDSHDDYYDFHGEFVNNY